MSIDLVHRNTPGKAKAGGHARAQAQAATLSPLQETRRRRTEALREYVRVTTLRLYPEGLPLLAGGIFFSALSEVTGETESTLAGLASEVGLWPRSAAGAVVSAYKAREDGQEEKSR